MGLPTEAMIARWRHSVAPKVELSDKAIQLLRDARIKYIETRLSMTKAADHERMQRDIEDVRRAVRTLQRVFEGPQNVIARVLAQRCGRDYTSEDILAQLQLAFPDDLLRAADELAEHHGRRHIEETRSPFIGLVCELCWLWRGMLGLPLVISGRPPLSAFLRLAISVMRSVPANLQMHLAGTDLQNPDSFGAFAKATRRADVRSREFQLPTSLGRSNAYFLAGVAAEDSSTPS